jgi:hypothetical protein
MLTAITKARGKMAVVGESGDTAGIDYKIAISKK